MTFPTVTAVKDEFNRADERPVTGGAWQPKEHDGGTTDLLGVSSNQLVGAAVPDPLTWGEQWWNETIGPDLESRVELAVVMANGDQVRLYARLQSAGTTSVDGYYGTFARQAIFSAGSLWRVDNKVATQLGPSTGNLANSAIGDWLAFECEGSSLRLYRWNPTTGWEQPLVATDSTYPSAGAVALRVREAMRVDRWICGAKIPQPDTPIISSKLQAIGRRARGAY